MLELGAGTGYLALKMAERRPDLRWCATEMEDEGAAARLSNNIAAAAAAMGKQSGAAASSGGCCNREDGKASDDDIVDNKRQRGGRVWAAACDWNAAESSPAIAAECWDVVVGSDLVYSAEGARSLSRCLAALLLPPSRSPSRTSGGLRRPGGPPPRCLIAQTCGRWGGYGYDAALHESLKSVGLAATQVGGETMEGCDELRQHVAIFSIQPGGGGGDIVDVDDSFHLLLRARRLHAAAEAAAAAATTEDERLELEAARLFDEAEV